MENYRFGSVGRHGPAWSPVEWDLVGAAYDAEEFMPMKRPLVRSFLKKDAA